MLLVSIFVCDRIGAHVMKEIHRGDGSSDVCGIGNDNPSTGIDL